MGVGKQQNVNPWTNKSTTPAFANSNQSLQYSNKQIGQKFGEHMDQNKIGYRNPKEYIELANDIYAILIQRR